MDLVELERNMLLTMPGGWKMSQVEPMQPATTYAEFKKEILNEIARCLNMPYNVAAGNSSGYNYASGRLDHQTYYKSIRVDQAFMAEKVLDRVLAAWLWEYALEAGGQFVFALHDSAGPLGGRVLPDHQWFWDGHGARGPGQGGVGPGDAAQEPHHHAGSRILETGPGLARRATAAGQGSCANARTGIDRREREACGRGPRERRGRPVPRGDGGGGACPIRLNTARA
jgi:hypothetical protein